MEASFANGGADAVREKTAELKNLTDEQVQATIDNLKGLVALEATTEIGSKIKDKGTMEVTCNVEIPPGKEPGSSFQITLPNKTVVNVTVPKNKKPGDTLNLTVQVPKADESIFEAAVAK